MKKGIEVSCEWDASGHEVTVVRKERGKLTLDDIREALIEWGDQDYYGLVLKCIDGDMLQYFEDDLKGDCVELYRMSDVLEVMGRVKRS